MSFYELDEDEIDVCSSPDTSSRKPRNISDIVSLAPVPRKLSIEGVVELKDPLIHVKLADVRISGKRFMASVLIKNTTAATECLVFPYISIRLTFTLTGDVKWIRAPRVYYVDDKSEKLQLELKLSSSAEAMKTPPPDALGNPVVEFNISIPVKCSCTRDNRGNKGVTSKMKMHYTWSRVTTLSGGSTAFTYLNDDSE